MLSKGNRWSGNSEFFFTDQTDRFLYTVVAQYGVKLAFKRMVHIVEHSLYFTMAEKYEPLLFYSYITMTIIN